METSEVSCLKIIELENLETLNEALILKKLNHDFVVKYLDHWIDDKKLENKAN